MTRPRIALAVRVRDEWSLVRGLLESVQAICDEAWILDDASVTSAPAVLSDVLPRVVLLRSRHWSGEHGRLGEGAQRDHLLQRIKRGSACEWILQLDADERIDGVRALADLSEIQGVDGWKLPLVDFYITPHDERLSDDANPGLVRDWYGIETRWTLCLFRKTWELYVSRGDVREPQGLRAGRVARSDRCVVEHYGKSISVDAWERKADFYIARYPAYRDKWLARKGAAVHDGVSDFGTALVHRGDPRYDPNTAPTIHEYQVDRGPRVWAKRVIYGLLAPSLRSVTTTVVRAVR